MEGALGAHGKAADLQPYEAAHRCNIAMLYSMQGEPEKALENFRAATQLDPGLELAASGQVSILTGDGLQCSYHGRAHSYYLPTHRSSIVDRSGGSIRHFEKFFVG